MEPPRGEDMLEKIFDLLMAIFELRNFIATLKMYSQTDWADRAEIFRIVKGVDCRTVQKITSRSDPYGRLYRPIRAKMAIKILNSKMALSRLSVEIFLYFCAQNSKLHDICSTSKIVHPPFKSKLERTVSFVV